MNKWYFSSDKFEFYNSPLDKNKKRQKIINYTEEMRKIYLKYNAQRLRRLNNIIRKPDTPDNFKNILFKINKFKENKKEVIYRNNNILNNHLAQSEIKNTKYKTKSKTNLNNFKTLSVEKPSKLKNIMEDIYFEINKSNNILRKSSNFNSKLSKMKTKIKYDSITNEKNNIRLIKNNNITSKNRFTKSSFSNMDDLLKLCSKRNLKKYFYNINMK